MIHPSDFGAVRGFVEVARQRSFTAAAASLGVTPSSLSQLVRGLEERIGARLLNRTTRSVSLTEAGALLVSQADPAISALTFALDQARSAGSNPVGTVRLHCFHAAADMFVAPILPTFMRAHPGIVIDLTIDDTIVDLVAEGYDAGIRIGEVIERDMIAVQLGDDIRQIAVASPDYLAQYGIPDKPAELLDHRCIRWRWPGHATPYAWEFFEDGKWFAVAVDGPLIASSRTFTMDAALAGMGIAFLKESAVKEHISQGRLIPLLDRWSAPFSGFHLCYPRQRHMAPPLKAVVDAIMQEFGHA